MGHSMCGLCNCEPCECALIKAGAAGDYVHGEHFTRDPCTCPPDAWWVAECNLMREQRDMNLDRVAVTEIRVEELRLQVEAMHRDLVTVCQQRDAVLRRLETANGKYTRLKQASHRLHKAITQLGMAIDPGGTGPC